MKSRALDLVGTLAVSVVAGCALSPPPSSAPAAASAPHAGQPAAPPRPAAAAGAAGHTVRLYPANNAAQAGGVRTAQLTAASGGRGTIEFTMPYGETLKGEYAPASVGAAGFGSIYNAVFGPNGVAATNAAPSGNPTTVSGYGVDGTRFQCEYYDAGGHASGACHTSTGFLDRLQY